MDNSKCAMNCNGKGDCLNGVCECFTGFSGFDCSERACPVVCNGRGQLEAGKCKCTPEWHGPDCSLAANECQVPDCNRNGDCVQGACQCNADYAGEFCDIALCKSRNCSNNGVCLMGECKCFTNYTGADCSRTLPSIASICSSHGDFDYTTKSCRCHKSWSGPDCARNDNCLDKLCSSCKNGWSGINCQRQVPLTCDARCGQHGICINGSCNCSPGFQGRNCEINSCPNGCSSNGICEKTNDQYVKYQCVCNHGWTGRACEVAIEMFCNDDIDNDNGKHSSEPTLC